MEETMKISGGCLCGAVRFHGQGEAQLQVKCYCTDCRKLSAAGHAAMMGFTQDAVSINGEVSEYHSKADSGRAVMRAFCPKCGAGLYAKNAAMPHMIFLRASSLDDPNLFDPQLAVFASRAPNWDRVNEGLHAFPEGPPNA
jgi:hypothetical protein